MPGSQYQRNKRTDQQSGPSRRIVPAGSGSAGIGSLTATALIAAIGNGSEFRKARDLGAWLGLVPRQFSTGGKQRLLGLEQSGNNYLRQLFVHGARAVFARIHRDRHAFGPWLTQLDSRKKRSTTIVALANKLARIAWAVLTTGQPYRGTHRSPPLGLDMSMTAEMTEPAGGAARLKNDFSIGARRVCSTDDEKQR